MNLLVVARHEENTAWAAAVPWTTITVQKDCAVPNQGREASSYLWAVTWLYPHIGAGDTFAFVQGNPFPHCPDLLDRMRPVREFQWLDDGGQRCSSDRNGFPHHGGLPVAQYYEKWLGTPFPEQGVEFAPGGQFAVTGREILAKPLSFWRGLYDDAMIGQNPWVLERVWEHIFA